MIKFIQKQRNKDGFTMVELIIVIAVMAILAAIVVPRMGGIIDSFKEKADERICANYARELQLRIELGESVGSGTPSTTLGTVVSLIAINDAVPTSDTSAQYRYLYTGTTLTVYVDDSDVTSFTGLVNVSITNVSEID